MFNNRPTHKELTNKIRQARQLVEQQDVIPMTNEDDIVIQALDLGYLVDGEMHEVLCGILDTLNPDDYAGQRPPQRAYEKQIKGCELLGFSFFSNRFNCAIYFKFTISNGSFWLVSLHRDNPA